jgi:ketosteroid isomerase-like protein
MTPREQLETYCEAFNRRELEKALSLFAAHALFEMPLLGQRLVGTREIAAGLARVFEVTRSAAIELSAHEETAHLVLAEGRLTARLHRDAAPISIPMAVALESGDGRIARLSAYLDAHPYRAWTDGLIFASRGPQQS